MLEESEDFKRALKVVIKRQMRHLMEQLREEGEEVVILSANMNNKTCSHFGSTTGEWFISEQENLISNFLKFCIAHSKINKATARGITLNRSPYQLNKTQGVVSATNVTVPVETSVATPVKHTPQKDDVQAPVTDGRSPASLDCQPPASKRLRSIHEAVNTRSTGVMMEMSNVAMETVRALKTADLSLQSRLSLKSAGHHHGGIVQVAGDFESQAGSNAASFVEHAAEEVGREVEVGVSDEEWPDNVDTLDSEPFNTRDVANGRKIDGSTIEVGQKSKARKRVRKPVLPVTCNICGVRIMGKGNLNSHIRRIHLGEKKHKCNVCSKVFWSGNDRDIHQMSVHTRKCESCKEYVVESVPWEPGINMRCKRDVLCACGAVVPIFSAFGGRLKSNKESNKAGLQATIQQSDDGTRYACGTCGKLFMKKNMFEQHVNGHFSVRPWVCEKCGASFRYEGSLRKHKEKKHDLKCVFCKYCNKSYSNVLTLNIHVAREHCKEAHLDLIQNKNSTDVNTEEESQETMDVAYKRDSKPKVVVQRVKTKTRKKKSDQKRCFGIEDSGKSAQSQENQEEEIDSSVMAAETTAEQILLTSGDRIDHLVGGGQGQQLEVSHLVITSASEPGAMGSGKSVTEGGQVVVCEESLVDSLGRILRNSQVVGEEGGVSIIVKQV